MLTLTDNRDAGSRAAFSQLLAGYPLPSGEYYAIALTWPAREIPRPGCVWTHTLLLRPAELDTLKEPAGLLSAFARPTLSEPDALRAYSRTRQIPLDRGHEWQIWDVYAAATLIWALYEPPIHPVNLHRPDLPGRRREELLLRVWGQQWPALRATFAFAEAPVTPRHIAGRLFDLQITDTPERSRWEEAGEVRTVRGAVPQVPGWCLVAAEELEKGDGLSRFLGRFGPQLGDDRGGFAQLARIWTLAKMPMTMDGAASRLVETIGDRFPRPWELRELKRELLGTNVDRSSADEGSILRALGRTPAFDAFADEDLNLKDRVAGLLKDDRQEAFKLFGVATQGRRDSRLTSRIVEGCVAGLGSDQLRGWAKANRGDLPEIVGKFPVLATRPEVWPPDGYELWHAIANLQPRPRLREEILNAILGSKTAVQAEEVLGSWPEAAGVVLDNAGAESDVAAPWIRALPSTAVSDWLRRHGSTPVMSRTLLETLAGDKMAALDPEAWERLVESVPDAEVETLGHLLAAASRRRDRAGATSCLRAYNLLYPLAMDDSLTEGTQRAIGHLSPNVPRWDVARRLAVHVNRCFRANNWPADLALEVQNRAAFRALLEADRKGKLARVVAETISEERVHGEAWQQHILEDVLTSTMDGESMSSTMEKLWRSLMGW